MALPEYEAKVWAQRMAAEYSATPAPYYGVHLFEVNGNNWDAVVEHIRTQHARLKEIGGRSHLWTVRDHGDRKRVCWVQHYPASVSEHYAVEIVNSPEFMESWTNYFSLLENYEWFCNCEAPAETPSFGPFKLAFFKVAMKVANLVGLTPKPNQ